MTRRTYTLAEIFLVPALVALLSAAGLVIALLDDGVWDVAGVLLLASVPAAAAWGRWRTASDRRPAEAAAPVASAGNPRPALQGNRA